MKYLPNSSIRYDTNFTDEVLSTEWNESELENDDLKNYNGNDFGNKFKDGETSY